MKKIHIDKILLKSNLVKKTNTSIYLKQIISIFVLTIIDIHSISGIKTI